MYVIGTAGHVDHGKSTLVLALTGIDPDRLREEKERQMTIDLGFAWLDLPNGEQVGIVDVPGHRDFIENMLAGVGGIDAALLIIAADEGVMPQTREHLSILDLLGVDTGIVALTKVDLVESEEWVELVTLDIVDTLAGTTLEDAPIITVSAREKRGLDTLLAAIQDMLAHTTPRPDLGRPRLPVDRVFTISGFGTVVTGTLVDGFLEVGQAVEIQPAGLEARVRGLQSHKQKLDRAGPGTRVAVNLSGVSKADLERGDVVTTPGWLHPTRLTDVKLRYLPGAQRALRHNTEVKFFSGAAETLAHVRILGQKNLAPGAWGWAQLRLQDPVALVREDRFIIRQPSPPTTIGGGVILNPHPGRRYRRFRPKTIERLKTLAQGDPEEILLQTIEQRGPIAVRDLAEASGVREDTHQILQQLLDAGEVLVLSPRTEGVEAFDGNSIVATPAWWTELLDRLNRQLAVFHRQHPLQSGMPREALRSSLHLDAMVFNQVLTRAAVQGDIVEEGPTVRLSSHSVRLSTQQQQKVDALLERFHRQPYATPSIKESIEAVGEDVLNVLIDRGDLIQLSAEVLFTPQTYEEMVRSVREAIQSRGSVTLAEVRDLFDTSRKYAQALLEYMDQEGTTRRVEDRRVLRGS